MKKLTGLGLIAVLLLASLGAMCSRESFLSNAKTIHQSYLDAEPLFRQLGIPTADLNVVAGISNDLITAFEQNQDALALDLIAALITRTGEIVDRIADEGKREKVKAALALGNIALHWIANRIVKNADKVAPVGKRTASATANNSFATVEAFTKQEPWKR